jgi:hypothetical protein
MEPKDSLTCSQEPITSPYPVPVEQSPQHSIQRPFRLHLSSLHFLWNQLWFRSVVSQLLKFASFSNDLLPVLLFWFCPVFCQDCRSIGYKYLPYIHFWSISPYNLLIKLLHFCLWYFSPNKLTSWAQARQCKLFCPHVNIHTERYIAQLNC